MHFYTVHNQPYLHPPVSRQFYVYIDHSIRACREIKGHLQGNDQTAIRSVAI